MLEQRRDRKKVRDVADTDFAIRAKRVVESGLQAVRRGELLDHRSNLEM